MNCVSNFIPICHVGVIFESILNVSYPAEADIQIEVLSDCFRLKADIQQLSSILCYATNCLLKYS